MASTPKYQFQSDADVTTSDAPRRAFVRKALAGYKATRTRTEGAYSSWQHARDAASEIKYEGVNHLDEMLEQFERNFTARGGKVFWASNGQQALDYIIN